MCSSYFNNVFKFFRLKYLFKNFNYIFTFYFFRLCSIFISIFKRILYKFKKNNYENIGIKVEVILLESLNKLGSIGDLVTVKDGYARNYLIPQKKALRANDENKEYFSKIKQDLVEKNKKIIEDAKLTVQKISKLEINFIRNASDNGQLYGSVSPKDVSNFFTEKKININSTLGFQIFINNSNHFF